MTLNPEPEPRSGSRFRHFPEPNLRSGSRFAKILQEPDQTGPWHHYPLHLSRSRLRIRKQIQMHLSLRLGNPRCLLHLQTEKSSNWAAMGLGFSDNTSQLTSLTMIQANI